MPKKLDSNTRNSVAGWCASEIVLSRFPVCLDEDFQLEQNLDPAFSVKYRNHLTFRLSTGHLAVPLKHPQNIVGVTDNVLYNEKNN